MSDSQSSSIRQRAKAAAAASTSEKKQKQPQRSRATGSQQGMMRMYTEDTPGLLVDPVVVLVFSLVFIGSVFALHIYGKFTRA